MSIRIGYNRSWNTAIYHSIDEGIPRPKFSNVLRLLKWKNFGVRELKTMLLVEHPHA